MTDARTGAHVQLKAVETTVASMWASLLNLDHVGNDDSFLLLGGESLLAVQIAARIKDDYGVEIPLRSIFLGTCGTVAVEILHLLAGGSPSPS